MKISDKILVGTSEGKSPIGRPGHRWKTVLEWEVDWEVVDWMHLAQDRDQRRAFVNMLMNLQIS
jgi:hypothetical protein